MSTFGRYTDAEDERPTSVYRIFDAADRLIYVGCAEDVFARIKHHRAMYNTTRDAWLIHRGYHRHESVEYPTRPQARAAERAAIRDEAPWLNRHHNPKRWKRIDNQWVAIDALEMREFAESTLPVSDDARIAQQRSAYIDQFVGT